LSQQVPLVAPLEQADRSAMLPDRPLGVIRGRFRRLLGGAVLAIAGPAVVTVALQPFSSAETFKVAALLYLVPVMFSSAIGGLGTGLLASGLSFVALDYYFTNPMHQLGLPGKGEDVVALGLFLIVAFGVARTLSRERADRRTSEIAQRRLAFLAGANELLQRASLDFDRTMTELAHLSVPGIADWCTIDVRGEDGRLRTIAVGYSDTVRAPLAENLAHQNQPDPNQKAGLAAVIRTGRPELYPVVDDDVIHMIARDPQHAALLRGLELRSLIIMPLLVRGRPIGAVKFASVRTERRYTPDDLTLAQDLALRASTALENVQLYAERTRAARTLQRSLLPSIIPSIDGLEIEPRFEPYGDGDLVGGDFYDVFRGSEDRFMFVVGDVCGKGSEAAALTGLARHTIRAVAMRETSPAAIMASLNQAVLRADIDSYCTVALASVTLDDDGATATIVRGGHPAPIVLRAFGDAELAGEAGSLLGVFDDATVFESTVRLHSGDAIVLYTDGVLDERADDPERLLAAIVRDCAGAAAKEIADRILEGAQNQGGSPSDDRAILVVRVMPDIQDRGIGRRWS
jgi:serine phosphatase RsbU (regulator of sigma subunit)